jgi:hypothetical protein
MLNKVYLYLYHQRIGIEVGIIGAGSDLPHVAAPHNTAPGYEAYPECCGHFVGKLAGFKNSID